MNKMLIIFIVGIFFSGCSTNKVNLNMPVRSGMMMEVKPSDTIRFNTNPDRLQIYWFGTASHYIQFGEIALLTDSFVTPDLEQQRKVQSDQMEVKKTFGRLKQPPDAIFIGHSHADHLLDAHTAMLKIPTWSQVPLYGSRSTQNILMGHGNADLNKRVRPIKYTPYGEWVTIPISKQKSDKGYSIDYMALETAHTPHFSFTSKLVGDFSFSGTLLDGIIAKPLSHPPTPMEYQSGEVYNFLFRLRHNNKKFIVMMLGSPMPLKDYPHSLPPQCNPIDVVIGLAASAKNVDDYPKEQMKQLKPRVIILSHFNNFFHKNADEILHIESLPLVDIEQYLLDVQKMADYPGFEKIIVPAITQFEGDLIRNVILVESKK